MRKENALEVEERLWSPALYDYRKQSFRHIGSLFIVVMRNDCITGSDQWQWVTLWTKAMRIAAISGWIIQLRAARSGGVLGALFPSSRTLQWRESALTEAIHDSLTVTTLASLHRRGTSVRRSTSTSTTSFDSFVHIIMVCVVARLCLVVSIA